MALILEDTDRPGTAIPNLVDEGRSAVGDVPGLMSAKIKPACVAFRADIAASSSFVRPQILMWP
ncbi:hypothetical protein H9L15_01130 [Sphingomonas daechungensis]|uniref:Uncharacterized protein n=2 Tax=Sphingomonas daechungensis TaxID=1176646 RepID=A0ABX6T1Z5_9SPHN|nr:hypothetical protein H9L15_01130 [Sphingomonas daechungensis]